MRQLPYRSIKYNTEVEREVLAGKRPTSYPGSCPQGKLFWHQFGTPWTILMEECWAHEPFNRPTMASVVERINRINAQSKQKEPQTAPAVRHTAPAALALSKELPPAPHTVQNPAASNWVPPPPPATVKAKTTDDTSSELEQLRLEVLQLKTLNAQHEAAAEEVTILRASLAQSQSELRAAKKQVASAGAPLRDQPQAQQLLQEPTVAQLRADRDRLAAICQAANNDLTRAQVQLLTLKKKVKSLKSAKRNCKCGSTTSTVP